MASIISAGTTSGTSLNLSGDTSGVLQLASNGSTTAVTINTAQKVGIGTTPSGSYILEVNGNPNFNSVGGVYLTCGTYDVIKNPSGNIIAFGGVTSAQWDTTALYTGGTERMRILSDGKACIGITTAQQSAMLSVTSGANNTSIALKGDSGTNCGSIRYTSATTGNNCWQLASNENNFFIFDADASHYAYLGQDPTAWSFASDARIKKDIIDLPYGLATILAVQPRRFAYICDGKEDIGFVAQELQAVVPEAVVGEEIPYSDDDTPMERATKTMGVSKDKLIPILVKAIQELKAELDATKAEVQALKGTAL